MASEEKNLAILPIEVFFVSKNLELQQTVESMVAKNISGCQGINHITNVESGWFSY